MGRGVAFAVFVLVASMGRAGAINAGETLDFSRADSLIETAIDRIGPEWHDLSKRAKDMGSAAVLLALLLCAGIWGAAVFQRIFIHG